MTTGGFVEGTYDDVASVSVENEDVKLVSVTMELRVGEDVVVEEVVVGLPNGFVGFDSTVGLGFVMAEDVAKTDDDGGPVFSVVVVVTGLDTGFEVDAGILVGGFGLAIVVDGFEVVVGLVGFTFCAGLVVAMVVNF